ncbi:MULTISPECIES: accessory gene regulator AgrB [Staphylococcus]|uniref:accessory gene regulator AgrB n=1 Tax=Staphylococcus TaxID=1279 RepID=UPI00069FEBEE|nr:MULTISPECIES: accessory gene regulator AgrB [Staphylococcus]MBF2216017.1 accessory gene regulator AgrB [Staphylococcus haemolyticus]MBF2218484.1 accessory gene regulator AgrB [Staphylococcus haemolyticus]MBF2220945.1 accessory gene regulator AgrB [Staphylococcus haemolyticus]MBF2235288.1 accessory gene regulator AgrB [Staphylococcus haemolyticus]MDO0959914.1 accessory gene regulator AgrB [Staphylococcus haemolyticus]
MKAIDNKIEQFALYLQRKNNLDHIQFLKVRLGLQVVVSNLAKTIVTYGVALIFHTFLYTLFTHVSYFLVRRYAHGAHAKSSLLCHVQNLALFVALPWLLVYFQVNLGIMYSVVAIGTVLIIYYAPSATKKQPIPSHLKMKKKLLSIIITMILLIISFLAPEPFKQLILLGITLESITLLPIFFPREDY